MERTMDYVNPQPRAWTNNEGKTFYFVEGNFDDGSSGSVFCGSQAVADETLAALKALVGTNVDYELEAGKEYNGQTQWRIKGFPGKPAGGGGNRSGGGGMSHAQAGIMSAASALGPQFAADTGTDGLLPLSVQAAMVIELAEILTEHLFSRRKSDEGAGDSSSPAESHTPAPSVAPADAITLPQMKRIKELGVAKGIDTPEDLARYLAVDKLGDLTSADADTVIASWS